MQKWTSEEDVIKESKTAHMHPGEAVTTVFNPRRSSFDDEWQPPAHNNTTGIVTCARTGMLLYKTSVLPQIPNGLRR